MKYNNMYNVLWIDDEHEQMTDFKIEAINHGFRLEGFKSYEEGFTVLESKIDYFDLILLDGLFFQKQEQEIGTEDVLGIGSAIAKINELRSKKVFPWFVLSGQEKFTNGKNLFMSANQADCFDKTKPSDITKLFKTMKDVAEKQSEIQLKYKYQKVLEIFDSGLFQTEHFVYIFNIIKYLENNSNINTTENLFNPMRKIIEYLFMRLGELGIIPKEIISNGGWINGSSLFLANKHKNYAHNEAFIPNIISANIYQLVRVTQDASHTGGNLQLMIDKYLRNVQSDYLYRSCAYILFDLLIWFDIFIKEHSKIEDNKKLYSKREISINTQNQTIFTCKEKTFIIKCECKNK